MGNSVRLACVRWTGVVLATLLWIGTPRAQPGEGPPPMAEPPGICVVLDPARDNLTEQERMAVRGLVLQAFASEQLAINSQGTSCTETYVLSNIKLGNTINVTISGQRGQRTGRSTSLDDLPNVYSQMVKSLVTGAPMGTGGGTTDRTNVTKDQSAPRRVAADSLKYVTLGYGGVIAGRFAYGPAFGFGYRKELDRIALDVSGFNFLLANDSDPGTQRNFGFNWELIRLAGMYYSEPTADETIYYGGALSYGWIGVNNNSTFYSGSGLEGHALAGYEAFRSSTIRGFLQLDLTLPFFKARSGSAERYTPAVSLQVGFGWGKSNVVRVINE